MALFASILKYGRTQSIKKWNYKLYCFLIGSEACVFWKLMQILIIYILCNMKISSMWDVNVRLEVLLELGVMLVCFSEKWIFNYFEKVGKALLSEVFWWTIPSAGSLILTLFSVEGNRKLIMENSTAVIDFPHRSLPEYFNRCQLTYSCKKPAFTPQLLDILWQLSVPLDHQMQRTYCC